VTLHAPIGEKLLGPQVELWETDARSAREGGVMPPEESPQQPTLDERRRAVEQVKQALRAAGEMFGRR